MLTLVPSGHESEGELSPEPIEGPGLPERLEWLEGLVGSGSATTYDGSTSELTDVLTFESERDADADDFREYVAANRNLGDEYATLEDYSVTDHGRTLVLSGTVRTRTL